MSYNATVNEVADAEIQTTNNTWTEVVRWSPSPYVNNSPGSMTGNAYILCRNKATNACAFWTQPFGAKFASGVATATAGLPDVLVFKKELALMLTDVRIIFDGLDIVVQGKGLASTTLTWISALNIQLLEWGS